jgi:hypothetical protein
MFGFRFAVFLSVFALLSSAVSGQTRSVRDSALTSQHIHLSLGLQSPTGDLADRFGTGGNVGVGYHVKQRSGFYWGVQTTFGFGMTLHEQGVLSNLLTPAGELIDNEGAVAFVTITGRSGSFLLEAGKLLPALGPNPNSGLLLKAGIGSFHHRLHFENTENRITQLEQPQLAFYDRLAWGVAGRASVGYFHMSDDGLRNFCADLSWTRGVVWPQRPFNADTQASETGIRSDGLLSLELGWVFHIYRRAPLEHWY